MHYWQHKPQRDKFQTNFYEKQVLEATNRQDKFLMSKQISNQHYIKLRT